MKPKTRNKSPARVLIVVDAETKRRFSVLAKLNNRSESKEALSLIQRHLSAHESEINHAIESAKTTARNPKNLK